MRSIDNEKNDSYFVSKVDKRLYHISNKTKNCEDQYIQLVIPLSLRNNIIENTHLTLGHFGLEKTYSRIREYYYWPNMYKDTVKYIESCNVCIKSNLKRYKHKLGELPMPNFPFEIVGIDLVGPFVTSNKGNNYVFTLIDHFY